MSRKLAFSLGAGVVAATIGLYVNAAAAADLDRTDLSSVVHRYDTPDGETFFSLSLIAGVVGSLVGGGLPWLILQLPETVAPSTLIAKRTISLRRVGEETTAVRFRLNQSGRLVPGSIHNLRRPLRATWGSAPRNQ